MQTEHSKPKKCLKIYFSEQLLVCLYFILLIRSDKGINKPKNKFDTLRSTHTSVFLSSKVFNVLRSVRKSMIWRQLSSYALSSIHLNRYNSCFKFILMSAGNINLNPGPITMIYNYNIIYRSSLFVNSVHLKPKNCISLGTLLYPLKVKKSSKKIAHKEIPPLTKKYAEFCIPDSIEQIITSPSGITDTTVIQLHNVNQSDVIDLDLSHHVLIFCTRKTLQPISHKHNEILVLSMKYYTIENF